MKRWYSFFPGLVTALLYSCLFLDSAMAQVLPQKNYPKDYFSWPLELKPGIVANFGEMRPNHYHMGLDCRTDQKVNQRVIASAAGYIAKVKVEPYGFGQCIYINHPNGLTTLYAHLNAFYPELEKYVKEQQYKQQSWRVFLDIPPDMFPVGQGQFIALSGSTGGSQGPHVHFEIRDTKTDKVLNPQLFNFPLPDNRPPDIFKLAVYDRCISVFEQTPKMYSLKKVNGVYTTNPPLIVANTDKLSFAISATDRYNDNNNGNGIYEGILYENESPVVGFQVDSISYAETREVNGHIDYKLRSSGGPFMQHLSRLPGYTDGIYTEIRGNGVVVIEDDSVHHIRIEVKDPSGNASQLRFDVRRGYVKDSLINDVNAYYTLREFHPGYVNVFENDKIRFYLSERNLYDSIRFKYAEVLGNKAPANVVSPAFMLHTGNVPVRGRFPIRIFSTVNPALKDKIVMWRAWNGQHDYQKAAYENGWYKSEFREFGYFSLMIDTIPPVIAATGFKNGGNYSKQSRISFVVTDNTEEVTFNAWLDGQWLRFSNDKGRTFIYNFDELCLPGEHELKITAADQVGNVSEKVYHFVR